MATATLHSALRGIELLLLDVDGVLTDGSIVYADNGVEIKTFHVRDGSGLKVWHLAGKRSAIITGRTSRVVEIRAQELGVSRVYQGASDKLAAFDRLLADCQVRPEQVAAVGDDLPDVPILRRSGLAAAVADGCPEARAAAHYVTRTTGGKGAVREVIELILRGQGLWGKVIEPVIGKA